MKRVVLPILAILGSAAAPLAAMAIIPFFVAFTWALVGGGAATAFSAWRLYRGLQRPREA